MSGLVAIFIVVSLTLAVTTYGLAVQSQPHPTTITTTCPKGPRGTW